MWIRWYDDLKWFYKKNARYYDKIYTDFEIVICSWKYTFLLVRYIPSQQTFKVSGTRSVNHLTATVQPRRKTSRENGVRLWWMTTAANLEQKFQKTTRRNKFNITFQHSKCIYIYIPFLSLCFILNDMRKISFVFTQNKMVLFCLNTIIATIISTLIWPHVSGFSSPSSGMFSIKNNLS